MIYQIVSTSFLLIGFYLMAVCAGAFAWMFGYVGSVPAAMTVETYGELGRIFGGLGGLGAAIFLSGLFRRVVRAKKDYEERKLVNLVLRMGIIFFMFAAAAAAITFMAINMVPEYFSFDPMIGYYIAAGLGVIGILMFIKGLTLKKPGPIVTG